ncbi:MAG: dynamin family protein [Ignavibacteria bacterium]|nr:dynamin family protein [Ignavibacteria bacterium]
MNEIKDIINEIFGINRAIGAPDLTKPVSGLLNSNDKTIYVAVLGQFKSGKSSLVNSIIGENLLPVGVVPVTAIVTRLRFGVQPKLIIQYLDGKETSATIDELPQYVTEKLNPENVKQVAQAIVEHPALEPFKNISMVDTPGLGSLYRHNSETTQQWLPFTGVAIISVSAERPLSEEDINLVKGIAQYCPEITLVITKTDLFKNEELTEIRSYITSSLKNAINRDIPVFDYSVYQNSGECRKTLIEKLILPLHKNAASKLSEIAHHKTNTIIGQSLVYTELALQSAMKREAEKDSVNKLLQEIRNNRHHHEREMLLSGSSFKGEVRDKLEKIILPFRFSINGKLNKQFTGDFKNWKGSLYQVSRKYEKWLNQQIGNEVKQIDNDCFDQVNQIVRETAGYYQYSALQFRQRLDEKLFQAFGVHIPEAYWQIDFTGIDKPDITIYRAFDSHLDTLLFFLPMKWFHSLFFRHFSKQIPYETDKNLHRYISELNGKINKTIDTIHRQALQYISNEIMTVENILQQATSDYTILKDYMERLKKIKTQVYAYDR